MSDASRARLKVRASSPLSPADSAARFSQRSASATSPRALKMAAVSSAAATVSESSGAGAGMSMIVSIIETLSEV
jgi:hypothetical protein